MTVDVVIPTLKQPHAFKSLASLTYLPFPIRLHLVTEGSTWPKAVNLGLARSRGDVLLMDDDAVIRPDTFTDFDRYYDHADIFGFKLLLSNGNIQHAGGIFRDGIMSHRCYGIADGEWANEPLYCCHVTTSLCYIKTAAIRALGGFEENWPGYQSEDVDFSFRALKAGLKILYVPYPAYHDGTQSKRNFSDFHDGCRSNLSRLTERHLTPEFMAEIAAYPKPLEAKVDSIP